MEWQKTRGKELLAEASKNKETGEVTNEEVSIDPFHSFLQKFVVRIEVTIITSVYNIAIRSLS